MAKLSYWARKIHRLSLWLSVVLGLIQVATGLALKYPSLLPLIDQNSARLLHVQTAGYFAAVFGIQALTGLIMYGAPWLLKRGRHTSPQTKLPN